MKRRLGVALGVGVVAAVTLGDGVARAADMSACVKAAEASQELRDKGRYASARHELLMCSSQACPAQVRVDCVQWLQDLERLTPSVVVHPKSPTGEDLVDVLVYVDGELLVRRLDGKPILVDPGAHAFRYEAPGFASVEQKVLVSSGEKSRVLDVTFQRAQDRPSAPASDPARSGAPVLAWALGAVGVVSLGAAGYFGITGLSERSDLWSSPCSETGTCSESDLDSTRTKLLVADVAGAVGVVSLAVATYLFVTTPRSKVGVGALPGGGSLRFSASF